jgi:hypothetical protein
MSAKSIIVLASFLFLSGCAYRLTNLHTYERERDNIDRFDR